MRTRLLALTLAFAAATTLHAQKPMVIEHGAYAVHLIQHTIGTEQYTVTDFGDHRELTVTSSTNDRGMKRSTTSKFDFSANYTPIHFEQTSDARGATTVSEDYSATKVPTFAGPPSMSAAMQAMMLRYWLVHHRPLKLPLTRKAAGGLPLEIKEVGHDSFLIGNNMVRLTRFTIANLIFGREIVWLNDSRRIAAVMTFAGGLPQEEILDEYAAAYDPLFQSGVRQEMLDLADLTREVAPEATGSYAITGARLIDATGAPAVEHSTVLVRNGKIAAAGPASSITIPAGMRVIHAEGKSLLPGLWEMHSHYSGVEFGPALLSAGVTTARDCGGEFEFLTAVRSAIDKQNQLGPRLLLAGLMDSGGPLAFGAVDVNSIPEAVHQVDVYADSHFDQIKVYTQLQPDVLTAIAAEAHRRGLTVTGHVPAAVNSFQGVADGMDQINHLQFVTRSMLPDGAKQPFTLADLNTERAKKLIALFVEKGTVIDPTLGWGEMASHPKAIATASFEPGVDAAPFPLAHRFRSMGGATDPKLFNDRMEINRKVVFALFQAGVPIVPGSDTGLIGYGLDRELELYVQAGMTPMQAIQSATIVSARAMRHDADSGTVTPGKRADLILVDGNPLANISDLRKVTTVITDGRLYSTRKLAATVGFTR
ncbi:MAG: amidohydrolase family protein [Acidobacteriota bacterium]|nr:amidohydrolase family protein [Acidobacteriota bacterium]